MRANLLRALLPRSAKDRLALVCMVTTTLITFSFGALSYYLTEQRLQEQQDEFRSSLRQRLMEPVALALWNFDKNGVDAVLDAQLGAAIQGLRVFDATGRLFTERGSMLSADASTSSRRVDMINVEASELSPEPFGVIHVEWSNAELKLALHQTLLLALAQLVGMNLVLLGVLWGGVGRCGPPNFSAPAASAARTGPRRHP